MTNAIVVEGLVKRFGTVVALDGIDFEVPAGTVFGLLGPNGAGKTTAVRVLSTILRPDGGRAEVLGHDVARDPRAVRSVIGLAGQYAAVDPNLTGAENLRLIGKLVHLPRGAVAARAQELLERFGLALAGGRPVRTYSGGMRRRLDLAAALVHRPPVLFLDEPTTGLDLQGRSELWEMIRTLVADGTTVLLTTQYLEEADRLADRIAVVGLPDEAAARRAHALLARDFAGAAEQEGTTVRLKSHEGAHALMGVLRAFDADGLEPATLTVREPSLDDVFLRLTGRHAEPAPGPEPLEAGIA